MRPYSCESSVSPPSPLQGNHPLKSFLLRFGFQVDSVFAGGLSVKENAGVLAEEMRAVVLAYVRILRLPYLYFFLGVGGGGMLN